MSPSDNVITTLRDRLALAAQVEALAHVHSEQAFLQAARRVAEGGDQVIPVGESRRLKNRLSTRSGVYYTELQFQHLNPATLPVFRLVRELAKFYSALYPLFRY